MSLSTSYAAHALVKLACSAEQSLPCDTLVATFDIPTRFQLQVLGQLVEAGVLQTSGGAYGAYQLSRAPDKVSLADLVDLLQPSDNPAVIPAGEFSSTVGPKLAAAFDYAEVASKSVLSHITIAELCESVNQPGS